MSRESKFNFISMSQILSEKPKPQGSIVSFLQSQKTGVLAFSKLNPDISKYENAWVRLYVDAKKNTIAWKFLEREPLGNMHEYVQIKKVNIGKFEQYRLNIPSKMAKLLDIRKDVNYKQLEIKEYKDGMIEGIQPFKYIILENPETEGLRVIDESNEEKT